MVALSLLMAIHFILGGTAVSRIVQTKRRPCTVRYYAISVAEHRELAYQAFSVLANKNKSWLRLGHLVDLAISSGPSRVCSVADVGTDHGLLAVGLALSARFDNVIGVDVSPKALKGALQLSKQVQSYIQDNVLCHPFESLENSSDTELPIDFRLSDGLQSLQPGEASAICIAGMGVNTMTRILQSQSPLDGTLNLDRLQCQQLLLQPTNSRPRNLMKLYQSLQFSGWQLSDERIEFLSRRWYISSSFVRSNNPSNVAYPTSKLSLLADDHKMARVVRDYWIHHWSWLQRDYEASGGKLHVEDQEWLQWVAPRIEQLG